ncbi:MAG TPA: tetratricopeptide repeat protein [Bacillus sp. (in: firmicutes)]|uniref:tetratricopeptide repeat protein n=1 Tax=Bacillus litorisediminis TaxID=2922713 RepID=UPI001FAC0D68|nr:tetratricopeptide repeat protein [Bacillus litorisediminis]HWO75636.1 tetratricopeptide repeat protein [Bacillus sp. (in: firmicutes)]
MSKHFKVEQTSGKILSFTPTGEYYFTKGLKAYHRGDLNKAKKYLERAYHLEPSEPLIACQLAMVHTEIGQYQSSNELLHLILEQLDDHMTECYYFLANNYAYLGHFREAFQNAQKYVEAEPNGDFRDDAEELLEIISMELGLDDADLEEEDELIRQQDEARLCLEAGEFEKAIDLLNDVIESHPDYWSAYNNLALAHFYLGNVKRANQVLETVLEKNPGNLHALCNSLIFAHYQKDFHQVHNLYDTLKNIHPIMLEHRYKLGATFALIGKYELAYQWLRKLQKQGFDGDGAFFYWLSVSAYYTGKKEFAKDMWKRVIELSPERKGQEPWIQDERMLINDPAMIERIWKSEEDPQRLFALFLLTVSDDKKLWISKRTLRISPLSADELQYFNYCLSEKWEEESNGLSISIAHQVALNLYNWEGKTITWKNSGLFLTWFTAFLELKGKPLQDANALAGALFYFWKKLRGEAVTQKDAADVAGVSVYSLRKYTQEIKKVLL